MERNDTYFSDFRIVFYRLYILEVQKREKKDFKSRLAHQKRENPIRILSFFAAAPSARADPLRSIFWERAPRRGGRPLAFDDHLRPSRYCCGVMPLYFLKICVK